MSPSFNLDGPGARPERHLDFDHARIPSLDQDRGAVEQHTTDAGRDESRPHPFPMIVTVAPGGETAGDSVTFRGNSATAGSIHPKDDNQQDLDSLVLISALPFLPPGIHGITGPARGGHRASREVGPAEDSSGAPR